MNLDTTVIKNVIANKEMTKIMSSLLSSRLRVSSQVKPATFRHKPYNILVLRNSLSMLKSVAVTCHVYNFAVMNKSI